jgi:hypothetical protein
MAAHEVGEEPEYVRYDGDREGRLWPGEAGRSITCWADEVLANDRLKGKT